MQKSDETSMSKLSHRKMQASTTLSRKYTKRPSMQSEIKIPKSLKISRFSESEMNSPMVNMGGEAELATEMTEIDSMEMNNSMQANPSMMAGEMLRTNDQMSMGGKMYDSSNISMSGMTRSNTSVGTMMRDNSPMSGRPVYAPETMPVYPDYPNYPEESASLRPTQESVNKKMKEQPKMRTKMSQQMEKTSRTSTLSGITAKEMKEQAIKKAMSSASKVERSSESKKSKKTTGMHFGFGRVVLALTCASVAVMAIVYFVNLNMPDISLSVVALQNGMEVTYPSYIPRDYSVSSVTSEDGKVTMTFDNSAENKSFTLTEERSSWDSNTLLANYVKSEYGENYTMVKEQGLTLFVSGSNAAWVNGGNVYKITANNGTLTNKQIKSIAVSL